MLQLLLHESVITFLTRRLNACVALPVVWEICDDHGNFFSTPRYKCWPEVDRVWLIDLIIECGW